MHNVLALPNQTMEPAKRQTGTNTLSVLNQFMFMLIGVVRYHILQCRHIFEAIVLASTREPSKAILQYNPPTE